MSNLYGRPKGHFLTERDLHIYDDKQLAQLQATGDEDLDGNDDSDDDFMISEDGYTVMTPDFDEAAMLAALESTSPTEPQGQLAPQEAYEAMKFQAPLSLEEETILSQTPFLQEDARGRGAPIRFIDDADHDEYIRNRMNDRYKAMDEVLEDEMYGDDDIFGARDFTSEEMMDRAGTEVGIFKKLKKAAGGIKRGTGRGFSAVARKAGGITRGTGRGFSAVARKTGSVARKTGSIAKKAAGGLVNKFVPGRDAQKAKMVKDLNAKLVKEHSNYLAAQAAKAGNQQPPSAFVATAKMWAKNKIQQAGLPTSYASGSQVAGNILGDDACGAWYNPFSWFRGKVKYVLVDTEGERLAEMSTTEFEAYKGTRAAMGPQQQEEGAPAEEMPMEAYPGMPPGEEAYAEEYVDTAGQDLAAIMRQAYAKGKQTGSKEFGAPADDDSEGDFVGKLYRSIKDPLADMDGIRGDIYVDGDGNIVRGSELFGFDDMDR